MILTSGLENNDAIQTKTRLLLGISVMILCLISSLMLPNLVRAADWSITCNQSTCTPTTAGTFLPNSPWIPGQTVSRTIEVDNHSNGQRLATLSLSGLHQTKNLVEVVQVRIANGANHRTIWTGHLSELLGQKSVELLKVDDGEVSIYQFQLTVDKAAGNQYQQAQLSFDLDIELAEVADTVSITTAQPKDVSKSSGSLSRAASTSTASDVAGLSLQRFFGNLVTGSLSLPDPAVLAAGLAPAATTQAIVGQLGARSVSWIWVLLTEVALVYLVIWKLRDRKLMIALALMTLISAGLIAWLTHAPLPILLACIPGLVGYAYTSDLFTSDYFNSLLVKNKGGHD